MDLPNQKFTDPYAALGNFAQSNRITYPGLDRRFVKDLPLFAIRENFDFSALKQNIAVITRTLPAMKRIFAKPIIRLKDSDTILPTEAVRVINSRSVAHCARHSELWSDIRDGMLIPGKLSTIQSDNEYKIYENIVFANAVDRTLSLVHSYSRILREMLFSCKNLNFNLLDRDNHVEYYLAIGKLHISYVLDYEKYIEEAEKCLASLSFIENTISARLGSQIYRECRKKTAKSPLKKTNIFRSHKDYAAIYSLMKWYGELEVADNFHESCRFDSTYENYSSFCNVLTLFSISHFNFEIDPKTLIDPKMMKARAVFKKWELFVENLPNAGGGDTNGILLTLRHDQKREYSILILPCTDSEKNRDRLKIAKSKVAADEYYTASPYGEGDDSICLSIYDISSFRRIQQAILRAMIYCDTAFDLCPFCGKELERNTVDKNALSCRFCRMELSMKTCAKTSLRYIETGIFAHKAQNVQKAFEQKDHVIRNRFIESSLHFRNITPLDNRGACICPKCHEVHTPQT